MTWPLFCHNYNLVATDPIPPNPGTPPIDKDWFFDDGGVSSVDPVSNTLPPPLRVDDTGLALSIQGTTLYYVPYSNTVGVFNTNSYSTSIDKGVTWTTHPITDSISAKGIDSQDGLLGDWNYRNAKGFNGLIVQRIFSKPGEIIADIGLSDGTSNGTTNSCGAINLFTGEVSVPLGWNNTWNGGPGFGNFYNYKGRIAYSHNGILTEVGTRAADPNSEGIGQNGNVNVTNLEGTASYMTAAMSFGSVIYASFISDLYLFTTGVSPVRDWVYGKIDTDNDVGQLLPEQWTDPFKQDNDPLTLAVTAKEQMGNIFNVTKCADFEEPNILCASGVLVHMSSTVKTMKLYPGTATATILDYTADIDALSVKGFERWILRRSDKGYYYIIVLNWDAMTTIARSFTGLPGSFTGEWSMRPPWPITGALIVIQEDDDTFYFAQSDSSPQAFNIYYTPNLYI